MSAPVLPVATRHYCPLRDRSWGGSSHIRGDGAPRRQKCHCGARLATETGCYGVFAWRADGCYPAAEAVHMTRTSKQAAAWIARNPGHGYVDRWIGS